MKTLFGRSRTGRSNWVRYNSCELDIRLNPVEARVLGALIEKDITTPDYYPLSLNALVNACNQKNNRDPVMSLDENAVRDALGTLQEQRLAGPASGADSRVTKYEHRTQEAFNFDRKQIAILCVLLLRGPQTPGELRSRTERMYSFEALDDVQSTLQRLIEGGFAASLPRQPGTKEIRYSHLFSGEPQIQEPATHLGNAPPAPDRVAQMEREIVELKKEVAELKAQFAGFKQQFE